MATPKFANIQGSNFHQELKKRVQTYFAESKKNATGNFGVAIVIFFLSIFFYQGVKIPDANCFI